MGNPASIAEGEGSQRRAMTLLKNDCQVLPVKDRSRIYVKNLNEGVVSRYCELATSPHQADLAIIRLNAPWYPVETKNPFAREFHHGDLDFKDEVLEEILSLLRTVPTIVVLHLDRPAVIPEINAACSGLLAEFGASDESVLEVIFGKATPGGKLPIELPCSMEAVRNQRSDMPYDSENPLYPFGFGLSY